MIDRSINTVHCVQLFICADAVRTICISMREAGTLLTMNISMNVVYCGNYRSDM